MLARPMSYRWHTAGEGRRAWMLRVVERGGYDWTPPPPFPEYRRGAPEPNLLERVGLLAGWPVKYPGGQGPLPRTARVLKAVDRDGLFALYEEAERLALGLGKAGPWLYAHLDADAPCYVVPDPGRHPRSAPGADAERGPWECRILVRMTDGEVVTGSLAVLPETFAALPATVSRRRQRRLAFAALRTERDVYLWGRGHQDSCGPEHCGYTPPGDRP